jgi:hypothetical protein
MELPWLSQPRGDHTDSGQARRRWSAAGEPLHVQILQPNASCTPSWADAVPPAQCPLQPDPVLQPRGHAPRLLDAAAGAGTGGLRFPRNRQMVCALLAASLCRLPPPPLLLSELTATCGWPPGTKASRRRSIHPWAGDSTIRTVSCRGARTTGRTGAGRPRRPAVSGRRGGTARCVVFAVACGCMSRHAIP